jgi:hypothetical protein
LNIVFIGGLKTNKMKTRSQKTFTMENSGPNGETKSLPDHRGERRRNRKERFTAFVAKNSNDRIQWIQEMNTDRNRKLELTSNLGDPKNKIVDLCPTCKCFVFDEIWVPVSHGFDGLGRGCLRMCESL